MSVERIPNLRVKEKNTKGIKGWKEEEKKHEGEVKGKKISEGERDTPCSVVLILCFSVILKLNYVIDEEVKG